MSNTEKMVSVPRYSLEAARDCLVICQDQAFQSCECESCPECGLMPDECTGTECAKTCQCTTCEHCMNKDSIESLTALLSRPAEHPQGEPIGWASQEYVEKLRSGQCNGIMIHDEQHDRFKVPIYTHADPDEVERLSEEIARLQAGCQLLDQDRNYLQAQLAERDAFAQAVKNAAKVAHLYSSGSGMLAWIESEAASLSTSAEPSTPAAAEIYTCVGKGGEYERIGTALGAGLHRGDIIEVYRDTNRGQLYFRETSEFFERMAKIDPAALERSAPVEQDERDERAEFENALREQSAFKLSSQTIIAAQWAWQAHAALERKP